MTPTPDIITRLRDRQAGRYPCGCELGKTDAMCEQPHLPHPHTIYSDAADVIEAQAAEIERLRALVDGQPTFVPCPACLVMARPTHPGELIREAREESGMRQAHLAGACRVSPKHMNQVEQGHKPLSATVAVEIEVALGKPIATVLMRMQADYDVFHARRAMRARVERQVALLDAMPCANQDGE